MLRVGRIEHDAVLGMAGRSVAILPNGNKRPGSRAECREELAADLVRRAVGHFCQCFPRPMRGRGS